MNVFSLFAELKLDDTKFKQGLDRAERNLVGVRKESDRATDAVDKFDRSARTTTRNVDKFGREADGTATSLDRVGREARNADRELDRMGGPRGGATKASRGMGNLVTNLRGFIGPALMAGGGVFAAQALGRAFTGLAGEAERAANSTLVFEKQLERSNIDTTTATGMVDRLAERFGVLPQTVQEATTLMLRAGGDLEDVERALTAAGASAAATGFDISSAFDNVSTAVATGRSELLETSGIVANLGPVQQEYARSIGKTVEELTDAELVQARVNAIYEESRAEIEDVDQLLAGLVGSQSRVRTEWAEVRRELGDLLLPIVRAAAEAFASFLGTLNGWLDVWTGSKTQRAIARVGEVRDALGAAGDEQSLRGVVASLSADLEGPAKEAFVSYAEQAIATAGDIEGAADRIVQAHARITNSDAIRQAERDLVDLQAQQAQNQANLRAFGGGEAEMRQELATLEAIAEQRELTHLEIRRQSVLLQSLERGSPYSAQDLQDLRDEVTKTAVEISDAQIELDQLLGREGPQPIARPEVEPTVVPSSTAAGATDADPTGLKELETTGLDVEVRLNVTGGSLPGVDPTTGVPSGANRFGVNPQARVNPFSWLPDWVVNQGLNAQAARWGAAGQNAMTDQARRRAGMGFGTNPLGVPTVQAAGGRALPVVVQQGTGSTSPLALPGVTFGANSAEVARARTDIYASFDRYGTGPAAPRPGFGVDVDGMIQGRRDAFGERAGGLSTQLGRRVSRGDGGLSQVPGFLEKAGTAAKDFGETLLAQAKEKVPALGAAIDTIASGGGPIDVFSAILGALVGKSEAFQNLLAAVNRILEPLAEALDPLFRAVTMVVEALGPLIEIIASLVEGALQPFVWIIENVLVPVFEWVADTLRTVYNALFGWLLGKIEDQGRGRTAEDGAYVAGDKDARFTAEVGGYRVGVSDDLPRGSLAYHREILRGLQDHRERATTPEEIAVLDELIAQREARIARLDPTIDSAPAPTPESPGPTSTRPPRTIDSMNFGGTPQSVQLAVATPLVEAAQMMVQAAMTIRDTFTGGDPATTFGSSVERFGGYIDRLVTEGIAVRVGTNAGGAGGGSTTAHLRGA